MAGWVKLYRSLNGWGWKTDPNVTALWVHLLTNANFENGYYLGYEIPAGSLPAGIPTLSLKTGLTPSQIRTAIKKLKMTGEIAVRITPKFSIISITKWSEYQADDRQVDSLIAGSSQANRNTIRREEGKKEKKEDIGADKSASKKPIYESRLEDWMVKEGFTDIPTEWGDYAHQTLFMTVEDINLQWDKFLDYWKSKGGSKGKKADWPATWRNWCRTSIEYKSERAK